MSTEIVDLDVLAPRPKKVKLDGREWKIPGDPPTGWLLLFRQLSKQFADEDADEMAVVEEIRNSLVDLFLINHTDDEQGVVTAIDSLGVGALVQAVTKLYSAPADEEPDGAERPSRASTKTKPPTTRTRRTASRSSGSSGS